MREIKFRGKNIKNGKWVYGSLVSWKDENPSIFPGDSAIEYEVCPETVGQFTGFYDANMNEIHEGDILREAGSGNIVQVVYDAPEFCFKVNAHGYRFFNHPENFNAIGNVHDNPGLLEGGRP